MIFDLILIAVIILFGFFGARRGFVDSVLGFVSRFAALFIGLFFAKPFASILASTKLSEIVSGWTAGLAETSIAGLFHIDSHTLLTSWVLVAISFVILFIVAVIAMKLLRTLADTITSIPVLKQIDSLLGFLLGVCEALIIIFVLLGILSIFEGGSFLEGLFAQIESSYLTAFLYNNNFVVNILFHSDLTKVTDKIKEIAPIPTVAP